MSECVSWRKETRFSYFLKPVWPGQGFCRLPGPGGTTLLALRARLGHSPQQERCARASPSEREDTPRGGQARRWENDDNRQHTLSSYSRARKAAEGCRAEPGRKSRWSRYELCSGDVTSVSPDVQNRGNSNGAYFVQLLVRSGKAAAST